MDIYALSVKLKEEGAATVNAALGKLAANFDKTTNAAKKTDGAMGKLGTAAKALGAALATAATFDKFITATSEAQAVQAQLAAGLESTTHASRQTVDSMNRHAAALSRLSTFSDEQIGYAQALLLTFTKISGDTFPKATQAVVDMATKMQGDLKGAAIQVGKALNDPVKGASALADAGIQFTVAQQEMIKSLVETNDIAGAQKIIFGELATQFDKSAEAARKTLGGALANLKNRFNDLFALKPSQTSGLIALVDLLAKSLEPIVGLISNIINGWRALFTWAASSVAVTAIAFQRLAGLVSQIARSVLGTIAAVATIPLPGVSQRLTDWVNKTTREFDRLDRQRAASQESWKKWRQDTLNDIFYPDETPAGAAAPALPGGGDTAVSAADRARAEIDRLEQKAARAEEKARRLAQALAEAPLLKPAGKTDFEKTPPFAFGVTPSLDTLSMLDLYKLKSDAEKSVRKLSVELEQTFAASISGALTTGVISGIENAVASGSIGEGFKTLTTTLLAGLGDAMVQFGTQSAAFAALMDDIMSGLSSLIPGGALAASLAMIGLGAALKGVASRMFNSSRGGGGGSFSGMGFGGGMSGNFGSQIIFGPTSATTAAGMTPRSSTNVTIIGPNDPSAQRAMQELMAKADSRGRLG